MEGTWWDMGMSAGDVAMGTQRWGHGGDMRMGIGDM